MLLSFALPPEIFIQFVFPASLDLKKNEVIAENSGGLWVGLQKRGRREIGMALNRRPRNVYKRKRDREAKKYILALAHSRANRSESNFY